MYKPELSDEENFKLYGLCSNPNGHGHNYVLMVTVEGEADPGLGYVMDLKELKKIVDDTVIQKVDHKNFNVDVDFMKGIMPTSENIVLKIWEQLENKINNNHRKLYSLKLFETENNSVEYRGK